MTNEELKQARLRLKMTQKELAEAIGMKRNTVAMIERGELPIRKTTELSVKYLLLMSKRKGKGKLKKAEAWAVSGDQPI